MQLRNVVVATDLSEAGSDAVKRAASIAAQCDAGLGVVHVIRRGALDVLHGLVSADHGRGLREQLARRADDALVQLADELAGRHGIRVDTQVAEGAVVRVIRDFAERRDANLIVLGERGAGLVTELLLGTTSERLLGRAQRPMLVVRDTATQAYRRVLVPVDFSDDSLRALDLARIVAPAAEIVLMYAAELPYEGLLDDAVVVGGMKGLRSAAEQAARDRLHAVGERCGLSSEGYTVEVAHGEAGQRILDVAEARDCDLIAIGRHGHNRLEEVITGSVTRHVLGFAAQDVLIAV